MLFFIFQAFFALVFHLKLAPTSVEETEWTLLLLKIEFWQETLRRQ